MRQLLEERERARRDLMINVPWDHDESAEALQRFEQASVAYALAEVIPPLIAAQTQAAQRQTVNALKLAGGLMPGLAQAVVSEAVRQATEQAAQAVVVKLGEQTQHIVTQTQQQAAQGLLDALTEAGVLAEAEVTT